MKETLLKLYRLQKELDADGWRDGAKKSLFYLLLNKVLWKRIRKPLKGEIVGVESDGIMVKVDGGPVTVVDPRSVEV